MGNLTGTQPEWITAVVTVDNALVSVEGTPVLLRSVHVTTAISSDGPVDMEDSVGKKFSLPLSSAVGAIHKCDDAKMDKLVVTAHASATGQITLVYKRNNDGEAGEGA
jgi:hypothetical protein